MEGSDGSAEMYSTGNIVTVNGTGNSVYDGSAGGNGFHAGRQRQQHYHPHHRVG